MVGLSEVKRPALRYHGAKFRLAPWVIGHFPSHKYYIEPYGGAAGVLLRKERCKAEVYNDIDGDIVNFFQVLRDPSTRQGLIESLMLTPYSRDEFLLAHEHTDVPIERARRTAVRASMGFGSGGSTLDKTGFRTDIKREYGTAMDLWVKYPLTLGAIGERLSGVQIENRPAIDLMLKHDSTETLHYVDPPYMLQTRNLGNRGRTYRNEMTDSDHEALLNVLIKLEGHVVLSGYETDLYNDTLSGWKKQTKPSRISSGRGTAIKTECLWIKLNSSIVEAA
jgi:DNA adenine methylase